MKLEFNHEPEVKGAIDNVTGIIHEIQSETINPNELARVEKRLAAWFAYFAEKCAAYAANKDYLKHERKKAFSRAYRELRSKEKGAKDSEIEAEEKIESERLQEATAIYKHESIKLLLDAMNKNLISIAHRLKLKEAEQKHKQQS